MYNRLIAFDVGTKRIGVAQSDVLRITVTPVGTFSPNDVFEQIARMVKESPIGGFIVGWPLTPKGDEGQATRMVQSFVDKLTEKYPDISIHKVDERYTSNKAMQVMIEAGVKQKKRRQKERVDQIAAALILQDFLSQNTNS